LNSESAAILEVLGTVDAMSLVAVCEALAADIGSDAKEIERAMGAAWQELVDAGLIRQAAPRIASMP
jgi:hypothetical protein